MEQLLEDRDAVLDDLRMHLLRAQQKMKTQVDNKRHSEEFSVGDQIFLKLQPYRQKSLARQRSE